MFSITVKTEGNERTLCLAGRIDSANAAEAERQIAAALEGFQGAPVLDAEQLSYISSAGLRVVLRLRKARGGLRIVNCSPELYEIFEMTGFTEMMDVSKAFRRV